MFWTRWGRPACPSPYHHQEEEWEAEEVPHCCLKSLKVCVGCKVHKNVKFLKQNWRGRHFTFFRCRKINLEWGQESKFVTREYEVWSIWLLSKTFLALFWKKDKSQLILTGDAGKKEKKNKTKPKTPGHTIEPRGTPRRTRTHPDAPGHYTSIK